VDLVESVQEWGPRHERSRLVLVGWPWLVGILWRLELDHLRRSTSRYRPKRDDERSPDQMNGGVGRGVERVVLAHRGMSGELGERKFCARKA
jgi:hypothetical protein